MLTLLTAVGPGGGTTLTYLKLTLTLLVSSLERKLSCTCRQLSLLCTSTRQALLAERFWRARTLLRTSCFYPAQSCPNSASVSALIWSGFVEPHLCPAVMSARLAEELAAQLGQLKMQHQGAVAVRARCGWRGAAPASARLSFRAPALHSSRFARARDDGNLSAEEVALLRARLSPEQAIPRAGEAVWLSIVGEHTRYYLDEELIA